MLKQMDCKPRLYFVFTNSFGDQTTIEKDLRSDGIEDLFWAIRDALQGCGFAQQTVDEWFPVE